MSENKETSKYNFPKAESVTIIEKTEKVEINYYKKEIDKNIAEITNNFNQKLDLILAKQNEAQENQEKVVNEAMNEVQIWLNDIMSAIGNAFDLLDAKEQRRFEELKHKEDWENTLTFVVPVLDKFGIKIETKTKLKDFKDLREKIISLIWNKAENKELAENNPNKQLED